MEYGKYETLARYGYTGAARPQGGLADIRSADPPAIRRLAHQIFTPCSKAG